MKPILFYGPAKCGKTIFIVKKFSEDYGKNPVIITPSSESVRYVKNLILSETPLSGFCGHRVITFDHLVNIIMEGSNELSNIGKYFTLRKIADDINLRYFLPVKNYIGFYELLSRFISELKSGEITPEVFLKGMNRKGSTDKDKEIYAIYSAYQDELRKLNVYDHEGKFWQAQKLIDNGNLGPLINSKLIIIDGFQNFSPAELKIIESIGKYIDEVIITLDNAQIKTYNILKNTFSSLKEENLPYKKIQLKKINIISCPGHAREIEEIAREIKRLIIYSGKKPDDMAVLFRDLTDYKELIAEIFNRYGIPFYISEGIPLIKNPSVRNILRNIENACDMPKNAYFSDYMNALNKYGNFISESIKIPDFKMDFSCFYESLIYIAETIESQKETYSGGQVSVMDVHRARGLNFPVAFIGGLIEKGFPKQTAEDPLYGDFERAELRKYGINVEESKEKQKEEIFLFHTAVSTAQEILYLTYPATDSEGKEELTSYYVDEIRKMYPDKIEEKKVHLSYVIPEFNDAYTYEDLVTRLLHNNNTRLNQIDVSKLLNNASIEEKRTAPYNGVITDKIILDEIKYNFGADYKFSVSQFNEYGACPFGYFAKRILGLEPIEELEDEIKPDIEGSLYHAILRDFYAEGGDIPTVAQKHFHAAEKDALLKDNALWKLKKEEIIKNIKNVIRYETNELPPLGIKRIPSYFEISFGIKNKEPLMINGIKIQGIIDRVDLTESGLFVVVDYKSGGRLTSANDILKGKNLQLPIYIMAVKDALNIGTDCLEAYLLYIKRRKYFHASPLVHFKPVKNKLKLNPLWDEYISVTKKYVIEYAKGIRDGKFSAHPNDECPPYCGYKDICRYQ